MHMGMFLWDYLQIEFKNVCGSSLCNFPLRDALDELMLLGWLEPQFRGRSPEWHEEKLPPYSQLVPL